MLEQVLAQGPAQPQPLMLLALAAERLGERDACASALERLVAIAPGVVLAWLMKGDLAAGSGDEPAAKAAYERAFTEARLKSEIPADVRQRLSRAAEWLDAFRQSEASRFRSEIAASGINETVTSRRFRRSLDIIFDEQEIYVQRPTVYYFPDLPQIQFYERESFAWVEEFESHSEAIAGELASLLEDRGLFTPHIAAEESTPSDGYQGLAGNAGWSSLYLWTGGAVVEENARRCPVTMAALEKVPLARFSRRYPSAPAVMFSMLKGGAKIPPHNGATNVRLICHLPLVVPPRCGLRVGNQIREWEPNKLLIFDDTIEHEAWNDSGEDRIVLIFDIWRPELTDEEKGAVTTFFKCLEATRG